MSSGRSPLVSLACISLIVASGVTSRAAEAPADSLRGRRATCIDFRSGESFTIGAQRLLASGAIASDWQPDGARLCLGSAQEVASSSVSDGSGGALVVWVDTRSGDADLYAQRLSASGAVAPGWSGDGALLCAARGSQYQVALCGDGAAGAIAVWQDYRGGETADLYAQRVLASGGTAWPADGVPVCADSGDQASPAVASDGGGGAHVVWHDRRGGDADLYYARIAADGTLATSPRPLVSASGDQANASVCSGGAGDLFVVWRDARADRVQLRALRLDATGATAAGWPAEGLALTTSGPTPLLPVIAPDGAGGLVAAWCERQGGLGDVRAQRLGANATRTWSDTGVVVCAEPHEQYAPVIISDAAAGAIVAWEDHRSGPADLYAQRVRADGGVAWAANGVPLAIASDNQLDVSLVTDGAGGALATWSDGSVSGRAGFIRNRPVVAERVPRFRSVESGPGRARLTWTIEGAEPRPYQLERRTEHEDWRTIAEVRADRDGTLVYEDRTVASGVLATYRLVIATPLGVVYLEEVPVPIPAPMPLALRFARSEDGGRAIRLAFVLETHERARVELLDVAGRRVLTHDLGSLGAGEHEATIGSRSLASGIYFVRLLQGRAIRTTRLALIR